MGAAGMPFTDKNKTRTLKKYTMRQIALVSFLLVLFCLSANPTLIAQEDLPTGDVTVVKHFEAKLMDAERITVLPEMPPPDTARSVGIYHLPPKSLEVDYPAPRIRPLRFRSEKPDPVYKGHVKGGGGLPSSLYADASYHFSHKDQYAATLFFNHHSLNNKKLENQRFSNTRIGGEGTYYFNEQGFAVTGRAAFDQRTPYYYGYHFDEAFRDTSILAADVRQRYNLFSIGGELFNSVPTAGDINYKILTDLYVLSDDYSAKETGFILGLGGTKWIDNTHSFDLYLITDFTGFQDTSQHRLHNFFLQPAFTFHGDVFRIKAGINIASNDDKFSFFPDVEAEYEILGNNLAAFAGAAGTLQKNNFRSLSTYNPYINNRLDIRNSKITEYYGGIRGDAQVLTYSARFSYKKIENLALFLPVDELLNPLRKRFDVVYDTATVVRIQGSIGARPISELKLDLVASQTFYTLAQENRPWHLPAFEIKGKVTYEAIKDQAFIHAGLFMQNGLFTKDEEGNELLLNNLFDISVGAEYFVAENFGFFLDINNLANNKRQRWYRYPTVGLNFLGGISLRF